MSSRTVYYLGPQGSFTHAAAKQFLSRVQRASGETDSAPSHNATSTVLQPAEHVSQIFEAVNVGGAFGVIAWENNVEGYVVPNLDGLIDAHNVVGCGRVSVNIEFDAFMLPDDVAEPTEVTAHPHGLAQCRTFTQHLGLREVPAASNAAACRDIVSGQIALGPRICGELYGLATKQRGVQDYQGSRTDFLLLTPRNEARSLMVGDQKPSAEYESVVAFIPLSTGAGVLAGLLDLLRDAGLNMTSFISRPIKGHDGTYSFIATIDAAPWQSHFRSVLKNIIERGDWVKTLAVYARQERPNPPVTSWMLPDGGAGGRDSLSADEAATRLQAQFI
ncbi:prephenate dehydratase [Bifidobacterium aquikefiri]|uniref:prephenate dehydratase n=1 Tax=Bifidobacterium aquikefiri TaxID=1653207 RepID=UPI0023F3D404|nr:prephenate dehydratase domain-containing protein [Bifidobacterium aquikefiri]